MVQKYDSVRLMSDRGQAPRVTKWQGALAERATFHRDRAPTAPLLQLKNRMAALSADVAPSTAFQSPPSSVAPSSNDPQTTPARCTSHESDRVIPSTNPARTSNGQAQCAPPRRAHCALRPVRGRRLFGRPLRPRRDARAASRSGAKYGLLTRSLPRTERTSFSLNPLRPFAPLRAAAFRHRSQTSLPNPTTAPSMFLSASSTRFGAASAAASSSQRCVSSSGLNGAEVFFGRLLLSRRA